VPAGRELFVSECGACHRLAAADTVGKAGPGLDDTRLDAAAIAGVVRRGKGAMPPFAKTLSDAQLRAVARYVADSAR
jgi:mono/diheme cytochrome c family protein